MSAALVLVCSVSVQAFCAVCVQLLVSSVSVKCAVQCVIGIVSAVCIAQW